MRKNNKKSSLLAKILPLAKEIQKLKKQAEALGLFTDDRELLECPCGLMEDVAFDGRLFTYKNDCLYKDTGLQFEKMDEDMFRCPVCKNMLKAEYL